MDFYIGKERKEKTRRKSMSNHKPLSDEIYSNIILGDILFVEDVSETLKAILEDVENKGIKNGNLLVHFVDIEKIIKRRVGDWV